MTGKIVEIQREHANRVLNSEWAHQLASMEQGVNFFEEFFLWATQEIERYETYGGVDSSELLNFYKSESPIVLKEARDALSVLQLLCRTEPQ